MVYLLRHGAPVGGVRYRGTTDDPLSAEGCAQMQRAVASCRGLDRIVTSPLRRCADFARTLAHARNLPLAVEPGFREMHFGLWEGQTPQALMTACPDLLRNFWADPLAHPPPGAEPLDAFRARVVDAWLAHVSTFEGRRLLLIVHGGTVRVILGHLQRISDRDLVGLSIPYASVHRVPLQQRGETGPEEQPPTDHL